MGEGEALTQLLYFASCGAMGTLLQYGALTFRASRLLHWTTHLMALVIILVISPVAFWVNNLYNSPFRMGFTTEFALLIVLGATCWTLQRWIQTLRARWLLHLVGATGVAYGISGFIFMAHRLGDV